MENTKYGKRREGRWTPIRAKAQDTRANPNSWETHLVRKRWDIGLLRALSLRIMMMVMCCVTSFIVSLFELYRINLNLNLNIRMESTPSSYFENALPELCEPMNE